jgi:hypothetical protein
MAPLRVAGFIEFHVFETDPLMLLTYCMALGMCAERSRVFESRPTREGSKRGRDGRNLLYSRADGAELDEMVERALVGGDGSVDEWWIAFVGVICRVECGGAGKLSRRARASPDGKRANGEA